MERIIKTFIGILIAALPFNLKAQVTFNKVYGGTNTETAYKVEICNDGGYITAGYTRSYGPGFANMHLIRTDEYGDVLWEFVEGGDMVDRAYAVAVLKNGGFVAVGMTNSFGAGQEDILVVKVDDNGNKVWRKTFGGAQAEEGWDIRETSDEGLIITGFTNSWGAKLFDAFLLKLDKNGNEQWKKLYGGNLFDGGFCVRQTSDGGYALLGQTLSHGQNGLFYMVKTDAQGNVQWEKTYGGAQEEEGRYFAQTSDGGYILIGKTQSKGAGDEDYYVVKLDAAGEVQWDRTYGGDSKDTGKSIEPTNDGGYILTGSSRSFNWLVPRIWILKISGTGTKIWERNFGDWNHDHGHHIMPTADGGYIATGHYNKDAAKAEDTYLLKLDHEGKWNPNAKDASVLNIIRPYDNDCANPEQKITVRIKNRGNVVLNSIPLTAKVTGSVNKTINETFKMPLYPGQEFVFSFNETINTTGGGNISVEVTADVSGDVNGSDNSQAKNVSVNSSPAPVVNLGADITKAGGSPAVELDAGSGFSSYKWSTGATTRKIMADNSQYYWVEVKDNNGCRASDTISVTFTSINEIAGLQSSLKIFPNPSDGNLELTFNAEDSAPFTVRVFSTMGQLVHEQVISASGGKYNQRLNLQGYPSGIYFINISDGANVATAKFIIR